ncbi:MAG: plasmid maintenance system killer [Rhodospirillaceae bacterium]|nr:plasmid maintenance system killer [Rhodospirillaceae bacterium]MYH35544.1 plasmid maintenance system killer [Rhodospirillaceae bacterium]MYK14181.1 plasmid maintenance system killer [Rhodospirillaceae bacterium]
MVIGSVRHRGLRRLLENDSPRLLKQDLADRVRNILTALVLADDIDELVAHAPPGWRVHRLVGDRRNVWSISVSGNWRITFEERNGAVERLDLEDYH